MFSRGLCSYALAQRLVLNRRASSVNMSPTHRSEEVLENVGLGQAPPLDRMCQEVT